MKKGILVLLLVLAFACKDDSKGNSTQSSETPIGTAAKAKELSVVINFKTNKAGNFKISLNNIEVDEFQKKNIQVIEKVSATTSTDMITAKFGANNISKNMSINFGNKILKEVEIETVELSYGGNTINIKGVDLTKHFNLNKFISLDETSLKMTTHRIDGKHNPTITLKKSTLNKLIK